MMGSIRCYIKKQNQKGKYLWLRATRNIARNFLHGLGQPYLLVRFVNFLHFFFLVNVRRWPPLNIDKIIVNSIFYVCLAEGGERRWVVKIPRLDNFSSRHFYKKILNSENFIKYSNMIRLVSADPILGKHFPPAGDVKRNGGYSSLYVEGYNLITLEYDLRSGRNLPRDVNHPELIEAIDEFLDSLKQYEKQNGRIHGDWALHNLLYDKLTKKIQNVDLEGFCLFPQDQPEADLRCIEKKLEFFMVKGSVHE